MKRKFLGSLCAIVLVLFAPRISRAALTFQEITSSGILTNGSFGITAADFDADGLMDMMLVGTDYTNYFARLYRNQGANVFAPTPLPDIAISSSVSSSQRNVVWADENGDGLLDFVINATNATGALTLRIYLQNADHTFTEHDTGITGDVLAWQDFDNDGRLDLAVAAGPTSITSSIFWREADGTYTRADLGGRFAFAADLDGDGDLDVVVSSGASLVRTVSRAILRNDRARLFTNAGIFGNFSYATDFNDDGRLDLIGTLYGSGFDPSPSTETDVYFNQGGLLFQTNQIDSISGGVVFGVGDMDGDGLPDLFGFLSPNIGEGSPPSFFLNNGGGTNSGFTRATMTFSHSAYDVYGITVADFDNDGDLDFITDPRASGVRRLQRNNLNETRTVATPTNLTSRVRRDRVDFSWNGADSRATSFNLRVGSTPGGNDVLSSASAANGKRLLSQMGNAGTSGSWHLDHLKPGAYYWSVQAVDWGYRGSEFAPEMSFTVADPGPLPPGPTISAIIDVVTDEDTSVEVPFVIGPAESVDDLEVTVVSTNVSLLPPTQMSISGTGTNRTLRIVPGANASGTATLTLRVTDLFGQSATNTFYVMVFPVNDPPTISPIADQFVYAGSPSVTNTFTIDDVETTAFSRTPPPFIVTATSSDTNLISNSALHITPPSFKIPFNSPDYYGLTIGIPQNKVGSTTITVSASDGQSTSTMSFVVVVAPPPFRTAGTAFGPPSTSVLAAADVNNDGRLDLAAIQGTDLILLQQTAGSFEENTNHLSASGTVIAADFNRDNFVDFLRVGADQVALYYNQQGTNFTTNIITSIPKLSNARVQAADLDNDGDLDLFIIGLMASDLTTYYSRAFLNDGGVFRPVTPAPFPGIGGNFILADVDGDGWIDIIFAGRTTAGASTNGICRGIGGGRFAYVPGSSVGMPAGFAGFDDINGDGVPEIWVPQTFLVNVGPVDAFIRTLERHSWIDFYTIDNFKFQFAARASMPTNSSYMRPLTDIDNDGFIDFLYSTSTSGLIAPNRFAVMLHSGDFQYTSIGNPLFAINSVSTVADFNGDGSADIIGTLANNSGMLLLTNATVRVNAQPGVPQNLRADQIGSAIRFSWDRPSDTAGISAPTYNVRIGSTPGGSDVVSSLSLPSGRRLMAAQGNTGYRQSLLLTNLTKGKYFWSVQAVDNNWIGGAFAQEQSVGYQLPDNQPPVVTFTPETYVGGEDRPGFITLNISDDTTPAGDVRLRVFSGDPSFLTPTNFTITGTGAVRTVKITPPAERHGETELIVQAIDASGAISTNITSLTITNINDPPTISFITTQYSDGPGDPVTANFIVSDIDDAAETLTLSALSGNEDILPTSSIVFGGTGTNRTVTLQTTSSTPDIFPVTIKVTDPGGAFAQTTFQMAFTNRIFKAFDTQFTPSSSAKMIGADMDNDGDLDLFIVNAGRTYLYFNVGGGAFTNSSLVLPGSPQSSADVGDLDNDGNLDLLIQGEKINQPGAWTLFLYRGDGHGNLTLLENTGLLGLYGLAEFGDFNNDGLLDIISTGTTNIGAMSALYLNQKTNFAAIANSPIHSYYGWPKTFDDFNSDGRLDLRAKFVTNAIAYDKVFLQTSTGDLQEEPLPWTGWLLAWDDFDNDGLPDALVSSVPPGAFGNISFQKNLGGSLAEPIMIVPGLVIGSVVVGDYDNDGLLDFLTSGAFFVSSISPTLFHNDGAGQFSEVMTSLPYVSYPGAAWADVDGDGDLDLILGGSNGTNITQLFRNDWAKPKAPPAAPTNLRARQTADGLWIEWDASAGNAGLTYNVGIGTAPGTWDILNPLSLTNGWRKVAANGNAGWRTSKLIRGLELSKKYYFTVQSVDTAFRGSAFAPEASVTIEILPELAAAIGVDGSLQLTVNGQAAREYVVETSTDLINWTELGSYQDAAGQIHINNVSANEPTRFVRARAK